MVDPQRFSQVVDNLLSNAVKYTPAGGRIEVDLSVTHDRVELVVLDTGIGISMRDRNHVFSRFFRTRHAAQQSIQGIGLGLSITKAIVDSHGGRIEVESEEGRGSTFRVRLPLRPATRRRASGLDRAGERRSRDWRHARTATTRMAAGRSSGQVPKISRVWLTSEKPCSAAIARVQRSTVGPSTSTVRPQPRQTRWW